MGFRFVLLLGFAPLRKCTYHGKGLCITHMRFVCFGQPPSTGCTSFILCDCCLVLDPVDPGGGGGRGKKKKKKKKKKKVGGVFSSRDLGLSKHYIGMDYKYAEIDEYIIWLGIFLWIYL